ncbi:MAG TPA: FGGY family carbohydrate kinase [Actinomycetota bacterium]|nr:FGGY family carbohydrate kinase [Actinomycetota bacterium]
MSLLLGIDIGTSRCKALLIDRSGAAQAGAAVPTPFADTPAGTEMGLDALWSGLAGVIEELGLAVADVSAIGICGMAECGAPLDARGLALAPVIAWHDPRGAEVSEHLEAAFGDAIGLRTGQRPRPVSTVAKLGWLREHGCPEPARWLGVPELCLWRLSGAETTEHSLASRTGCWDVLEQEWLEDIAGAAGFSTTVFPPVRPAGSTMGRVTAEAAAAFGVPGGVPVTLAGHDHLAGALGAGAGPGDLVNSVGTAETVVGTAAGRPDLRVALHRRTPVSVSLGGAGWTVMGGAARAGVILTRAAGLLGCSFAELDALALGAQPIEAAPLLPVLQSGAEVALPEASPGAVWRGLLEALAARTAETVHRVRALAQADRVVVIGGGSRSIPWLQAKTAAVGLPLARLADARSGDYAAARGAAVLAGVAAGWWTEASDAPEPEMAPAAEARDPGV